VVVETRPKKYPFRKEVNRLAIKPPRGTRRIEYTNDPGGAGYEAVHEATLCPECAAGGLA
jgi:hypothetical protein